MCLLLSVSPDKIFRVILVCRRLLPSYTSAVCICAVFQSHWCLLFIQCCQTRSSFLPLRENHWTVRKHWHLSLWKCGIKLSKECLSGYAKLNVLGAAIHLSLLYKFPCVLRQQTLSGNCLHFCFWRHRVIEMPLPPVSVTVSIKKKKNPSCAINSSGLQRFKCNCLQTVGSFSCLMINNTPLHVHTVKTSACLPL